MIQVTHSASFNFTGRGTSPTPKNSQTTWGSSPRHQHWCQLWRGRGHSDGRRCGIHYDSGTGCQYHQPEVGPEPQAASLGLSPWARRKQPPSQERSRRSATIAFSDPLLCTPPQAFYYYILWFITTHSVIPEGSSLISVQNTLTRIFLQESPAEVEDSLSSLWKSC